MIYIQKRRRHEEVKITATTTNLVLQDERDESDDESQQSPQKKRIKFSQNVSEHSHKKTVSSPAELTRLSSGNHSQTSSNVSQTVMPRRSHHRQQTQNQQ
jgi:hypothetical protein